MWDALPNDVQWNVLEHTLRPPLQLEACLVDLQPGDHTSVKFLSLRGSWLPTGEFACILDLDRVPVIEDDEPGFYPDNWLEFILRQRINGTLVLSNIGGEWIEIGKVRSRSYPKSTWHGVMRMSSSSENYNCCLFDNIEVYEESADTAPVTAPVFFRLLPEHEVTHMMLPPDSYFDPDNNLDAYFNKD